jgi:hypothetical protein
MEKTSTKPDNWSDNMTYLYFEGIKFLQQVVVAQSV